MKKIFSTSMLIFLISLFSFAQSSNDQAIFGIANGAIRSTCSDATGRLKHYISIESSCFNGGFVKRVIFYKLPNCPPLQPCIQIKHYVGSVTLDCNNNVTDVNCGHIVFPY